MILGSLCRRAGERPRTLLAGVNNGLVTTLHRKRLTISPSSWKNSVLPPHRKPLTLRGTRLSSARVWLEIWSGEFVHIRIEERPKIPFYRQAGSNFADRGETPNDGYAVRDHHCARHRTVTDDINPSFANRSTLARTSMPWRPLTHLL